MNLDQRDKDTTSILQQMINGNNKNDNIEKTVKSVLEKLVVDVEATELPKISD